MKNGKVEFQLVNIIISFFKYIIIDDMGMGKTLQAIALILKRKEENLINNEDIKTTLIICPV